MVEVVNFTIIKDKLSKSNEFGQVIENINFDLNIISIDTKIWNDVREQDVKDTINVFKFAFRAYNLLRKELC